MARVFLDSNIFLYAVGGEGPHRASCRELLMAAAEGAIETVTNTEVLQEILHVRSRRASVQDAIEAVHAAASLVGEVLPVTKNDVLVACDLLGRHQQLGARDALHVAVMKNSSLHLIASVDTDFDGLADVRRLSPEDARLSSRRRPT